MRQAALFQKLFLQEAHAFLIIDAQSNQVYIEKINGELSSDPDIPYPFEKFIDYLLKGDTIFIDDLWKFRELREQQITLPFFQLKESGTVLIFRRKEGQRLIWNRVELLIPDDLSPDNPYVFLYTYDIDQVESTFYDCFQIFSEKLLKIERCSLSDNSYTVIQEPYLESQQRNKQTVLTYRDEIKYVGKHFIHPEDQADYKLAFSPERLAHYFSHGNTSFSYFCRRKTNGLYRWVKILVVPSSLDTSNSDIYYIYTEDAHNEVHRLVDFQNINIYSKYFGGLYQKNIDSYYGNILTVLHGLTQSYVDFYMVNLEKDLYIRYRHMSGTLKRQIPFVGSYSQSSIDYINEHCSGEQAEELRLYCTSDKLREAMRDKMTLEYDFYSDDGVLLRTICQKLESIDGTPTKVLCHTIVVPDERLLKIRTFGNFDVLNRDNSPVHFSRKQSKQLLAYLIDRQGFPVTRRDIVVDILEKEETDQNAIKYCSTLIRRTINDLEAAGYPNVILKEQKTIRVNPSMVDCDYYHLLNGDLTYLRRYHNEYMKEYSWAEDTNAELLSMAEK